MSLEQTIEWVLQADVSEALQFQPRVSLKMNEHIDQVCHN
jgi:hypothetical protein